MRIIAGSARGRTIMAPATDATRPISDRAREALFNILGDVADFTVLDAYAGSGAIGLEALSRGALRVDGVESGREAVVVIAKNAEKLGFENQYVIHRKPLDLWLAHNTGRKDSYNLIVADPPFDALDWNLVERLFDLLAPTGILVVKHPKRTDAPEFEDRTLLKSRKYGASKLSFYSKG